MYCIAHSTLHIVMHKASCRDPNEIGASRFGSAVFEGRSDLFFLAKSDSKTRRRLNISNVSKPL